MFHHNLLDIAEVWALEARQRERCEEKNGENFPPKTSTNSSMSWLCNNCPLASLSKGCQPQLMLFWLVNLMDTQWIYYFSPIPADEINTGILGYQAICSQKTSQHDFKVISSHPRLLHFKEQLSLSFLMSRKRSTGILNTSLLYLHPKRGDKPIGICLKVWRSKGWDLCCLCRQIPFSGTLIWIWGKKK